MPRAILLFTNGWTDLPLEELAAKAAGWGYSGFELTCQSGFFDVSKALSEPDYLPKQREILERYELRIPILSNHKVGQLISDRIDERHRALVYDEIWGDGKPEGVRTRAIQNLVDTILLAGKMEIGAVSSFTGSPLWSYTAGYPAAGEMVVQRGLKEFAKQIAPILEACRNANVKFALEVHPGQVAFDLYSAEATLDVLHGCEEFGFTFDPAHLHWQGVEPNEFLRAFPNRIYHVHARDAILTLNGKSGILNGYLPGGDPRRGFQFRCPGHGSIDWEAILRELNAIGYPGPISVDYHDRGMPREAGAAEACRFLRSFDYLG